MSVDRWSSERDADVLGVVVHGPAVIARSTGIAMAVRCIFAHPGGLDIDLVLRAVGVQAEAASGQTFGKHTRASGSEDRYDYRRTVGSEPVLIIEIGGKRATAYPCEESHSGGDDHFSGELSVTVAELPVDGVITLTAWWPQAGLAEGSTRLTLGPLDDLENRAIHLLS